MQCKMCNSEVPVEAVFCAKCGARLGESTGSGEPLQSNLSPAERFKQSAEATGIALDEPEQDLWQGGFSGKAMIGSWVAGGVATLILCGLAIWLKEPYAWKGLLVLVVLIWGGLALRLGYQKLSVHYQLTSQRFMHKSGILKRVTDRIEAIDVDDVTYEQGVVQRLLGVGTIRISSSDRTHPELILRGIDDVQRIADLIDDTRRKERRRRGVHIESI